MAVAAELGDARVSNPSPANLRANDSSTDVRAAGLPAAAIDAVNSEARAETEAETLRREANELREELVKAKAEALQALQA